MVPATMVLGSKAKNRSPKVQIDYLVHVQEIKPWPPSQSLRSLRSVLIQWENGDRISGSTNSVVPTLGSIVGEGKIDFKESFRLSVTLLRDMSVRGGDGYTFQKNCLEFNLYEPRRDKTVKGQLLATATVDLADYGVPKDTLSISVPMNCKRSYKNTDQPLLYVKLQPIDKDGNRSSSRGSLSRGASLDNEGGESVSALMNEGYGEEAEISFTDDDGSSHSSATASPVKSNGGLTTRNEENYTQLHKEKASPGTEGISKKNVISTKLHVEKSHLPFENAASENVKETSCSSLIDLSFDLESPGYGNGSVSHSCNSSSTNHLKDVSSKNHLKDVESHCDHSSLPSLNKIGNAEESFNKIGNAEEKSNTGVTSSHGVLPFKNPRKVGKLSSNSYSLVNNGIDDEKTGRVATNFLVDAAIIDDGCDSSIEDKDEHNQEDNHMGERLNLLEKNNSGEEATMQQVFSESDTLCPSKGSLGVKENIVITKPVKSVRIDLTKNGLINNQHLDIKEVGIQNDVQRGTVNVGSRGRKDVKIYPRDTITGVLENKIQQLEQRVKMLEGELQEAAAVEAALYSVVAEHGSSMSKVHAPARRLSRFYLHVCRGSSMSRRATAARSAVSGIVLVAKACGNDVPRLTYWLSNSILLRTIISQASCTEELPLSVGLSIKRNGSGKVKHDVSSPLRWKTSSPGKRGLELLNGSFGDWDDPHTFMCALEKIEAWIFSRIIESIWWQTLTPYMQSDAAKAVQKDIDSGSKKRYGRTCSSNGQEKLNFSLDLWKKAFRDARERLCPLRAEGHGCGCLPVLARLVMEQCVARLDVAMFNAILRESGDEIPTDPVSDPISDSNVLPITAGKSSFGAGALLKNAIGNWSRWLTDLFDLDDDAPEDGNEHEEYNERQDASYKSFHLLNALSDLMMLPKDLLLSKSIRKEVCPTFGVPLIKRVIDKFVPDEFCPDPIPGVVFQALDSEDSSLEAGEEAVTNFPCSASAIAYFPPSTASIANIIGDIGSKPHLKRSGSSVLRKSYTSDDELDELSSPLALILNNGTNSPLQRTRSSRVSKENGNLTSIRYELLRDAWIDMGS